LNLRGLEKKPCISYKPKNRENVLWWCKFE